LSRTRYEPYGNTAVGQVPNGVGFTGHVNDADTGLVYMQQRYYDPTAGRFLSLDPVSTDADTGQSFGRYHYAENSPYRYIDPDGRANWETVCTGDDCAGVLAEVAAKAKRNRQNWERAVAANDLDGMQEAFDEYEALPGAMPPLVVARSSVLARALRDAGRTGDTDKVAAASAAAAFQLGMSGMTVIGRVKDLGTLQAGEKSMIDRLPYLGEPKVNWAQNSRVRREEMRRGRPIRDASPLDATGKFLNAERNLLRTHDWTFDRGTNYWMPPKP